MNTKLKVIKTQADIDLIRQAVENMWPTDPNDRVAAMEQLNAMIENSTTKDETRIKAINLLRVIDKQNAEIAQAAIPVLHLHKIQGNTEELSHDDRRNAALARIRTLGTLGRDRI